MKTTEEINSMAKEAAINEFPDLDYMLGSDDSESFNDEPREAYEWGFEAGYQSYQSNMEAEIQRRVDEKVKEYKEGIKKSLEGDENLL